LLASLQFDRRHVWWGLWLGAMAAFWIAAWDRFANGSTRAGESFHFVIHFGDLATLFALLVPLGWSYWRSISWGRLLGITAILAGLTASAWSGTRGAWLAVPVLGLYVLFSRSFDIGTRARVAVLAGFAALCVAVAIGMAGGVRDGVARAIGDAQAYEPGGDIAHSSGGQRLELWRLSWRHFTDHPFAGVGAYRLQQANRALAQQGEPVPPVIHEFGHAHNQYFEVLATGGVLGLTAFLALLVLPWRQFRPVAMPDAADPGRAALVVAGRATVLAFAVFALTQSVFNHQGPLGVFGFLVIYFDVLSRAGAATEGQ
jgi:O-antigen ligase